MALKQSIIVPAGVVPEDQTVRFETMWTNHKLLAHLSDSYQNAYGCVAEFTPMPTGNDNMQRVLWRMVTSTAANYNSLLSDILKRHEVKAYNSYIQTRGSLNGEGTLVFQHSKPTCFTGVQATPTEVQANITPCNNK
jgi:hypothetical protein